MAKTKISEWSATPANNTDVGGIDIAEGCAPSGINNAIREMMAQIKDMQAGTDGDNFTVGGNLSVTGTTTLTGSLTASGGLSGAFNGTVGATTPNTGVFTNLTSSGNTTLGDASTDTLTVNATPTFNVAVPVASGGTGASSLTANNVLLGNGTSAVQVVAPGTSGNVLTSNGTTWQSTTPDPVVGVGQTWTVVTGSRVAGTTYTNSTSRPIQVIISGYNYGGYYVNGTNIAQINSSGNETTSFIVPVGQTYKADSTITIDRWSELR